MATAGAQTCIFQFWGPVIECLGQKWVEQDLLCSCRPPPTEFRCFSGHLKSANPHFCAFRFKTTTFFDLVCVSHVVHPLKPLSEPCSIEILYPRQWQVTILASLMQVEKHKVSLLVCTKCLKATHSKSARTPACHPLQHCVH